MARIISLVHSLVSSVTNAEISSDAGLAGGGKTGIVQGNGPLASKQLEQQIKDYLQQ